MPFEKQYWGWVGGLIGWGLAITAVLVLFEVKPSGYELIAYSFAAFVLCTRLMHRFTRYRDWSQWAKEQKANKPS